MKKKMFVVFILVLAMYSCSKDEVNCQCNEYFQSSNGNVVLYSSGASMQFCDGTLPNPNPKMIVYRKECK